MFVIVEIDRSTDDITVVGPFESREDAIEENLDQWYSGGTVVELQEPRLFPQEEPS